MLYSSVLVVMPIDLFVNQEVPVFKQYFATKTLRADQQETLRTPVSSQKGQISHVHAEVDGGSRYRKPRWSANQLYLGPLPVTWPQPLI